jgi:hypothetical protein
MYVGWVGKNTIKGDTRIVFDAVKAIERFTAKVIANFVTRSSHLIRKRIILVELQI